MGKVADDQKEKAVKNTTAAQREVVEESGYDYSNGNRDAGDNSENSVTEEGGAEKGGPDSNKAQQRQPPDATR